MPDIRVSQGAIEALQTAEPDVRLSQLVVEVGKFAEDEEVRLSQLVIELILFNNFLGPDAEIHFDGELIVDFTPAPPDVCIPVAPNSITPDLMFLTEPLEQV